MKLHRFVINTVKLYLTLVCENTIKYDNIVIDTKTSFVVKYKK